MSLATRNDKVLLPFVRRGIQLTSPGLVATGQHQQEHPHQYHQTIRHRHYHRHNLHLHPKRPQETIKQFLLTEPGTVGTLNPPKNAREFHHTTNARNPISSISGGGHGGHGGPLGSVPPSYFQRPSLPANTIIRFVPQQTAWIVERMGKFSRILEPGLAILVPFIDRIAYVKSLKEVAIEIPSQSAITADNVTLELDGVLYTRVFDAYKAR